MASILRNLLGFQRIRTICVKNPSLHSSVLESGVKDLVFNLHGRYSILCLASCHGHWGVRGFRSEPYLYFYSEPPVAEWVEAFVCVLGDIHVLSRKWHVTGLMHPEHGLSFRLAPMDTSPIIGGLTKDRGDLAVLAVVLEKALERVSEIPPDHQSDYRQKKQYAERLILLLVVGVPFPTLRTGRFFTET